MQPEDVTGAEHLLRAARDAALSDAELERRVARKNAVVARALAERRLALPRAEGLLYDPTLCHALADRHPGCPLALRILEIGCSLATLEERLLKWSPDRERLLGERLAHLLRLSERVLAPETLVESLRGRSTLSPEDLALAAPLRDPRLLPVFLRTATADLAAWPADAAEALRAEALAALEGLRGEPPQPPSNGGSARTSTDGSPHYWGVGGAGSIAGWQDWWEREGRHQYPEEEDAMPARPHAPSPPIPLLPEDGGEFTLDPPMPFYYLGRSGGQAGVFFLRPRRAAQLAWHARLARAAAALLEGDAAAPAEFEGSCALEGYRVHATAPGEAIRVSMPDPEQPIAWLACSECGHAGYVRYAFDSEALPLPAAKRASGSIA
jgi:hypothetical protein